MTGSKTGVRTGFRGRGGLKTVPWLEEVNNLIRATNIVLGVFSKYEAQAGIHG